MATEAQPTTQAKRILVVEDELMIRMLLEDMLGELGYTVAAEAARIDEALEMTKNADFDLAILDADLKGQPALPVAALVTILLNGTIISFPKRLVATAGSPPV